MYLEIIFSLQSSLEISQCCYGAVGVVFYILDLIIELRSYWLRSL